MTISTTLIPGASYRYIVDGDINAGSFVTAALAGVNSFTTDNFSVLDRDLQYVVGIQVINSAGCSDIATTTISLNYVTADFIEIDGGTVVQNICSGTSPTLDFISVGAEDVPDGTNDFNDGADYPNGAAITYQWQKSEDNLNWIDIDGATARTYTPTPTLFQTTYFRRLSTSTLNNVACEEVSDNIITINVAAEMEGV